VNAPAAIDADAPEDLRFAATFVPAPLDKQIEVARRAVHQYRERNLDRTKRAYGEHSLHPDVYVREYHARRSVLFTLLQLKTQPEHNAGLSGGEAVRLKP
jgi:hypothetical protein